MSQIMRRVYIYAYTLGPGGSGILAFILVSLLQGWYVLTIPSKLKHD